MSCGFILFDTNSEIILVRNKNNKWSFPKGKFEKKDKDNYHCARREFFEETGLVGFDYEYSPEELIENREYEGKSCNLFIGRITKEHEDYGFIPGHVDPDNGDIVEVKFFAIDNLLALSNFHPRRKALVSRVMNRLSCPDHPKFSLTDMFLNPKKNTYISKTISFLLRHKLDEFKSVATDASVDIHELISKIHKQSKDRITVNEIIHVSKYCLKQRTEIIGERIRCVQGHSVGDIVTDQLMDEITIPLTKCYHATNRNAINSIKHSGLNKMDRHHIHFAQDAQLMRQNQSIIIEVNMTTAMAHGIKFYRARNGVILSPGLGGIIPSQFLIFNDAYLFHKKDKKYY